MEPGFSPITPADNPRDLEIQKKRLRENCREFESVMISYLMKTMREAVIQAEEPDNARETYEDMLSAQVSRELSKTSAFGLGDMLYTKLEPLLKARPAGAQKSADAEGAKIPGDVPAPPDPKTRASAKTGHSSASRPKSIGLKK
ncbi:MAG: rod-binding protein [Syntrophobacteraceae bacterium]